MEKDGHRPLLEDGGKSIATLAGAKTQAGGPGETVVAPGLSMDVNRSGPGGAMDLTTIYGARTQHTLEYLNRKGGTWKSETAVAGGLNWLARHQADDGHWSDEDKCEQDQPCPGRKPLRPASVGAGANWPQATLPSGFPQPRDPLPFSQFKYGAAVAETGLAVLAFQADGHYYFNEHKYSQQVRRGLDWLVKQQKDGCLFGPKQTWYEHGIGTFALAEACAVARAEGHKPDPRYLKAATQAVKFLERHQYAHGGWRYDLDSNTSADTSVTGWQVLALKSAIEAKIYVSRETMRKVASFYEACGDPSTGLTSYTPPAVGGSDLTIAVGLMVQAFLLKKRDSSFARKAAAYLEKRHGARRFPSKTDKRRLATVAISIRSTARPWPCSWLAASPGKSGTVVSARQ